MQQKKSINFGFRGWMLIVYQAIAFLTFISFTNYPMNILPDFYGGAQIISTLYTVATIICVVIQLILSRFIGKIKNIKMLSVILGAVSLVLALGIMSIPPEQTALWQVCYFLECLCVILWCTFTLGILVGQWFPRRKGTVMGIATFAFPLGNALIGLFADNVFKTGAPTIFSAFLPFFIIGVVGLAIGVFFIKDYPEQCGGFRDNDSSMTPEAAKAMMEAEIKAKETSVWTLGNSLKSGDFWFVVLPMGFLLLCAVGMMTQTASILGVFEKELEPIGGFAAVMGGIAILACVGSWLLGVLDTKYGTKAAIVISVIVMTIGGVFGIIHNAGCLLAALACLAIFMGASSNFTVSSAARYWRREDFANVFAAVNPIANILQAAGPMIIAILITTQGYQYAFGLVGILGVVSIILICMFKPDRVKVVDDKLRAAAGLSPDEVSNAG